MIRGGPWGSASLDLLVAACSGTESRDIAVPQDPRGPASGARPEPCWMEAERTCAVVLSPGDTTRAVRAPACRPLGDPSGDCFDALVAEALEQDRPCGEPVPDDGLRTRSVCVPLEAR